MSEDEKLARQKAPDAASFSIDVKFAPEVLFQLTDSLRRAFRTPDTDTKGVDAALMLQERYVIALRSIARFTKDTGIGNDVAERLMDLATAIFDLRDGIPSPLFYHPSRLGRSRDGSGMWGLRASAAVGMYCLMGADAQRDKKGDERAAADIALDYQGLSCLVRDEGDSLLSSLLSWHNAFKNKKTKNQMAQDRYDFGVASIDSVIFGWKPEQIKAYANSLLAIAERNARAAQLVEQNSK